MKKLLFLLLLSTSRLAFSNSCDSIEILVSYDTAACTGDTIHFDVSRFYGTYYNPYVAYWSYNNISDTLDLANIPVYDPGYPLQIFSIQNQVFQQGAVFQITIFDTYLGCSSKTFKIITFNDSCTNSSFCDTTFDATYAIPDGYYCDGDTLGFLMGVMQGAAPYTFNYQYNGHTSSVTQTGATESGQFIFADGATLDIYVYDAHGCFDHYSETSHCSTAPSPCDSITAHLWLDSISSYACPGDSIMFLWSYMNSNGNLNDFEYSWTYGSQSGYQGVPAGVHYGHLGYIIMEAGATVMQVTFIDSVDGCSTTQILTVIPDSNCDSTLTQIHPLQTQNLVSFYPNPASQDLNVQVDVAWVGSQLELVNSLGQVVKTEILQRTNHNLSLGHLAEGLYFAQIKNIQQGVITQKIVLKR